MEPRVRVRIVKCVEPTDLNFGGWDILVGRDGDWACTLEVSDYSEAVKAIDRAISQWFYLGYANG